MTMISVILTMYLNCSSTFRKLTFNSVCYDKNEAILLLRGWLFSYLCFHYYYMVNDDTMNYDLITILGPTASGKTALAVALACELKTEIISGDSRQVYRRMDLGTGKDLKDYVINGCSVPYHLIDIVEPGTKYNLFEYQRDFLKVYEALKARRMLPILCGGTGLYIESVLKGYNLMPVPENPELRNRLANHSLEELTEILSQYKAMHNSTDVDTVKRAIRAIENEEY